MTQSGSYNVTKFSTTSEGEIRRLDAQLDLFWKKEFALYIRAGLSDGMKILDAGCGPGYLVEKLLTSFPTLSATAVEIDPALVEVAQKRLKPFCDEGRCSIIRNSVLKLDFSDNCFDFIITRLVIEHVPDPEAACKELLRVLKPGGTLIVIDNDFEMHVRTVPPVSELADLYNAYCRARSDEGGNPKIGRELPLIMKSAGFTDIDLDIICAHSAVIGDTQFLKSEGPGIPVQLIKTGYLSEETYRIITAKWHDMLKKDNHAIVRQLYVAIAKKNSEGTTASFATKTEQTRESPKPFALSYLEFDDKTRDSLTASAEFEKIALLVTQHVTRLLNTTPDTPINDTTALSDLGIDSEMAIDLQHSLTTALQLEKSLPATLVFDYPTIRSITQFIYEQVKSQNNNHGQIPNQQENADSAAHAPSISDDEIERKLRDKLDFLDKETGNDN